MKKEEFFRNALPDSVGSLEGVRVLEATHNFAGPNVGTVLAEAGLVVAPIYSFPQIIRDEHIREREMVAEVEHPAAGKIDLYGVAAKFSLTPTYVRRPAPMMGQHNQEIYGERLGLSEEALRQLQEKGII